MKFSKENIIEEATLSGGSISGKTVSNLFNKDTLRIWENNAPATVTALFSARTIGTLFFFNTSFNQANITTYVPDNEFMYMESIYGSEMFSNEDSNAVSDTFTANTFTGFDYQNTYVDINKELMALVIEFVSHNTTVSCGRLWAGTLTDVGCAEEMQPFDESADTVALTRTNQPDTNRFYNFQNFNVTLEKQTNEFEPLRDKLRQILDTGFGNPRPFIFNEPIFSSPVLVHGILDSGRIGYNIFLNGQNENAAQATIGVREVT